MGVDDEGAADGGGFWSGRNGLEAYFGKCEECDDERYAGRGRIVEKLEKFFVGEGWKFLEDLNEESISFSLQFSEFVKVAPQKGIRRAILEAPEDSLACIGLAASMALESNGVFVDRRPGSEHELLRPRVSGIENIQQLKDLNSGSIGKFVCLQGTVARVSNVRQQVKSIKFNCTRCGVEVPQNFKDFKFSHPTNCPNAPTCKGFNFQPNRDSATTSDWQRLRIQENNSGNMREVGRMPRTMDVELTTDLIDSCIPGDGITVCGIVKTLTVEGSDASSRGQKAKTRGLLKLYVEGNSIQSYGRTKSRSSKKQQEDDITEADEELFAEIGSQGQGTTDVYIRPDIHCLIVGDPGLGKSQMLKAATNISPRGVYVCGNTSTTAGLTVSMTKEQGSNDFFLEAGALVLGDHGICCIDEFDKMGNEHSALLEAMEQQTVSIAKAGMICNLSAKTTVIAAANPRGGHYDRSKTVCENLKIALPLLSRFDLVFILLDEANEARDRVISKHVLTPHASRRSQKEIRKSSIRGKRGRTGSEGHANLQKRLQDYQCDDPLPPSLFRKYVAYARANTNPVLSSTARRVLKTFYLTLRKGVGDQSLDVPPVTTRQLESLIRLVQARAKAELRPMATEDDAVDIIEIMKASMMDTFSDEHGRLDFTRASGMSRSRDSKRFVLALHEEAARTGNDQFTMSDLKRVAQNIQLRIPMFEDFIAMINQQNVLLKRSRYYQLQGTQLT